MAAQCCDFRWSSRKLRCHCCSYDFSTATIVANGMRSAVVVVIGTATTGMKSAVVVMLTIVIIQSISTVIKFPVTAALIVITVITVIPAVVVIIVATATCTIIVIEIVTA